MAKKKIENIEEVQTEATTAQVSETSNKGSKSVTVLWNGGARTYSLEDHGENFKELAASFSKKHNGEIR